MDARAAALALLLGAAMAAPALAQEGHPPFTATEMMGLRRLSDPQVSPDGRQVAYAATEVSLPAGSRNSDLWLVGTSGGAAPRRLTEDARSDTRPRWSRDGKRIAFVSTRDGSSQVYVLDVAGGEPRKVTSLSTGAGGVLWVDDATLLVTSDVYADCNRATAGAAATHDEACNKQKADAAGKPDSGRLYDRLLLRHWDAWEDQRRTHLLVVPMAGGPVRDLTPGDRDVPPFSLGGTEDYAVSPDGREVAFVRNDDPVEATSTNAELYVVPVSGGPARKIAGSPGYDGGPLYSPDGRLIAFRAQERPGYEADRWRLKVYDRAAGATRTLTEAFDRQVEGYAWSPDSRTLYFSAAEGGREPIFSVPAAGGEVKRVADGSYSEVQAGADGALVATRASLTAPAEVWRVEPGGAARALTHVNDALLARFALRPAESVTYRGAADKDVQAWIVKPADFDAARKYPLLVLIHGGPQGAWGDAWSYRWNPQVFAAAGYVVFMPNPRGSIGFGQAFTDAIQDDWGGKAFEDVMKGLDAALAKYPFLDGTRVAAAGASYGGYMIDWIAGHTDRYRALVSHDGVFDLRSMAGSTEELWFSDWEFGGPYWDHPETYERWSPVNFAKNFKTPTLVVHGELDYRVPLEQGLAMFTALQRRGVPSRLLVFPDENHWVLKPVNSIRWYREVIGWLDQWAKSGR
jgi:dipeptidyl aminopeptidase/acylaminoacyl peptidase